jgi:hypothetical protein
MSYQCEFCESKFVTNGNLLAHQRSAKYCLALQGINSGKFTCRKCEKNFCDKRLLKSHEEKCGYSVKQLKEDNMKLKEEIKHLQLNEKFLQDKILEQVGRIKENITHIKELENRLENVAIKAAVKPTSVTNTNILNILQPLTQDQLNEDGKTICLEDIQGAKRLAQFAADKSLKGKVVTSDASRCILKFKKPNGEIIRDKNGIQLAEMFCKSIEEPAKIHFGNVIRNLNTEDTDFTEIDLTADTFKGIQRLANGQKHDLGEQFITHLSKLIPDKSNEGGNAVQN